MFIHNRTVPLVLLGAGLVDAGLFNWCNSDMRFVLDKRSHVHEKTWDIRVKQTVCADGWSTEKQSFKTKTVDDEHGFRVIPSADDTDGTLIENPDGDRTQQISVDDDYYIGKELDPEQPAWVKEGHTADYFLGANKDAWGAFKIKKIAVTKEQISEPSKEVRFTLNGKQKCSKGSAYDHYTQLWIMASRQGDDKHYYFCYELLPDWDLKAVLRITPVSENHKMSLLDYKGQQIKNITVADLRWREIRDLTSGDYADWLDDRNVELESSHDNSSLQKFHKVLIDQLMQREFSKDRNYILHKSKTKWNNQTFCQLWEMYFGVYTSKFGCYTKRQTCIHRTLYGEYGRLHFSPRDDRVPIITSKADLKKLLEVAEYYETKAVRGVQKRKTKWLWLEILGTIGEIFKF